MQATIPDPERINQVLNRLSSHAAPTDAELTESLLSPTIATGLDHWSLWTLLCLHRHLDRQKWVGYMVESRLKGDLRQIGCAGAFGHPDASARSGKVPHETDWSYHFHGCGCCFTNDVNGHCIDVDFTREGESNKIDRFFYSKFLLSVAQPQFPERLIRKSAPFENAWQVEIDRLCAMKCTDATHGLRLTAHGLRIAEALEPLVKQIIQLLEWDTDTALRNAIYATLALGDPVLANELVSQTSVGKDLVCKIASGFERAKSSRLGFLKNCLKARTAYGHTYLPAIADLGPELCEDIVSKCLLRSPVDGTANTALRIFCAWDRANLVEILRELVDRRFRETTGVRAFFRELRMGVRKENDELPRNYQITHAILALFKRVQIDSLGALMEKRLRFLIENTGGAEAGKAALLMYVLDKDRSLDLLRLALSGRVPAAREEAAAACVIIGDDVAGQILRDALSNPNQEIQHMAACALSVFPSQVSQELAHRWFIQNDGIKDPLGKEVTVFGRTAPVFTFEDVSHANMSAFFNSTLEKMRKDFESVL